jgi:hypothetical protein
VYIRYSDPGLDKNIVRLNSARWGGGVYLENSKAVLTNTVITENQAPSNGGGSGLCIEGSSPHLLHTTISDNSGGDGSGVYVTESAAGYLSDVALTNTVLVKHGVGITVTTGNTATLEGVLWHANASDWDGAGVVLGSDYTWGDPHFDVDGYHLSSGSVALDMGLSTGVAVDVDGDARPYCAAPDLGADEAVGGFACRFVYLPALFRND